MGEERRSGAERGGGQDLPLALGGAVGAKVTEDSIRAPASGLPAGAFLAEEGTGILKVIRDLEGQIDSDFAVRQALETDLGQVRSRIEVLEGENATLIERTKRFEVRDALADQWQAEVAFLNDEKTRSVATIRQLELQLATLAKESETLEEDLSNTRTALAAIKSQAVELQSKVARLEEETAATGDAQEQLAAATRELRQATDRVDDLEARLDATTTTRDAIELDLKSSQLVTEDLKAQAVVLKAKVESLEEESAKLNLQLKVGEYENARLVEVRKSLESKVAELLEDRRSLGEQLHAARGAITDIHGALEGAKLKAVKRFYEPEEEEE